MFIGLIDSQVEKLVKSCHQCALASKSPKKCELRSWPVPQNAWSRIHVDYAGPVSGQSFLIIVNAYKNWSQIFPMRSTTTIATINKLQEVFTRFSYPERHASENETQFTSSLFADFCLASGIEHVRTPPYYPQSHDMAERLVDTFKRALPKAKGEGTTANTLQEFLLMYRLTPNPSPPEGKSPAGTLLYRSPRSAFDLLKPPKEEVASTKQKMESYYNRKLGAK
ncbi:hypothetical protein CLF_101832 [Clonorchis sinensis]|uniref:Integrase catalytic domain-containing protein n=1 Tax=Clonorchis sinensis TaxID=79923 RepID=G7Y6N6_CLOSI|nr:hypothetical protein CLF_101832 [Clonorchis sinensis]